MIRDEMLKVAKPILFNTEMVKAILEGGKTCTRRVLKPQPQGYIDFNNEFPAPAYIDTFAANGEHRRILARYQPCDYLYVRETWRVGAWDVHRQLMAFDYKDGTCGEMVYIRDRDMFLRLVDQVREDARKAGCEYNGVDFVWEKGKSPCKWHPSIHMPKEAARIFLRIMQVRVERLKNIDGQDVLKEGVNTLVHPSADYFDTNQREAFAELWNSTIKKEDRDKYGWDANPWVWVYEFERVEVE